MHKKEWELKKLELAIGIAVVVILLTCLFTGITLLTLGLDNGNGLQSRTGVALILATPVILVLTMAVLLLAN